MSSLVAVATTRQDSPISAIAPSSSTGSMRRKAGAGSLRGFSSKPFTDVPSGAVDIERSATLLRVRPAGTRARGRLPGTCVLLLHVEQDGEDPAGLRRGAVRAEPARLVGRDHDVARVRIGRQRHVPGLVRTAQALLRGAGLAGDLDREVGEYAVGSAARATRGLVQAVEDRCAVLGLDLHAPPGRDE